MLHLKNQKGLTLVELLITIAVLAIVTAIALPIVTNVVVNSRAEADRQQYILVVNFIDKWDSAGGTLTQTGNRIEADWSGSLHEYIEVPDNYILSGAGSDADPYALVYTPPASDATTITEASGTLPDSDGTTTFSRDATGVTIVTSSANWESMTVQYDPGTGNVVNSLIKKNTNGTVNGALTKVSNTNVRISTDVTAGGFTFTIVYNGGSTGSFVFN